MRSRTAIANDLILKREEEMVSMLTLRRHQTLEFSVSKSYPARSLLKELILTSDVSSFGIGYAKYLFLGRMIVYYGLKIYDELNLGRGMELLKWYNLVIFACELTVYMVVIRYNLTFLALGVLDTSRK